MWEDFFSPRWVLSRQVGAKPPRNVPAKQPTTEPAKFHLLHSPPAPTGVLRPAAHQDLALLPTTHQKRVPRIPLQLTGDLHRYFPHGTFLFQPSVHGNASWLSALGWGTSNRRPRATYIADERRPIFGRALLIFNPVFQQIPKEMEKELSLLEGLRRKLVFQNFKKAKME